MPILDIQADVVAELPRLFVLKKGAEQEERMGKNNKKYMVVGKEQPHWRAHLSPGGSVRACTDFDEVEQVKAQGGKPVELRVFLAGDTMSEVFDPWMKEYVIGGRLLRMCDTEMQHVWLNEATGDYVSNSPKPCERGACKCTRRGGLKVFIEGLRHVGYVEVQTGSIRDIRTLTARLRKIMQLLDQLNGLRAAYGLNTLTLAAIPCIIRRCPAEVTYNDNGQRKSTGTKYFIDMEPDPEWFEMQREAVQRAASMRLEDMQRNARPVGLIEQRPHNGYTVDASTGEILDDDDDVPFDFDTVDEVDFMEGSGEGDETGDNVDSGASEGAMITQEQMDEIDDLGREIFGADEWLTKAVPGFRHAVGRDDIGGRGDLTKLEADIVLKRLRTKRAEMAPA